MSVRQGPFPCSLFLGFDTEGCSVIRVEFEVVELPSDEDQVGLTGPRSPSI